MCLCVCVRYLLYWYMYVYVSVFYFYFPRYWPFGRGNHRSPVNSAHKGQWLGPLMLSLIYTWINGWVNNRDAGDSRRHRAHYDVTIMTIRHSAKWQQVAAFSTWHKMCTAHHVSHTFALLGRPNSTHCIWRWQLVPERPKLTRFFVTIHRKLPVYLPLGAEHLVYEFDPVTREMFSVMSGAGFTYSFFVTERLPPNLTQSVNNWLQTKCSNLSFEHSLFAGHFFIGYGLLCSFQGQIMPNNW